MSDKTYNLQELGAIFGMTRQRVHQLALKHHLGSYVLNPRHWVFTDEDVRLLEERPWNTPTVKGQQLNPTKQTRLS